MGMRLIEEDLVSDTDVAWHEPDKLAQVIIDIIKSHKERNIRSMTFEGISDEFFQSGKTGTGTGTPR